MNEALLAFALHVSAQPQSGLQTVCQKSKVAVLFPSGLPEDNELFENVSAPWTSDPDGQMQADLTTVGNCGLVYVLLCGRMC